MMAKFGWMLLATVVCLHAQDTSETFYNTIRTGDLKALQKLLQAGGLETKDKRGSTPLMYAAAVGNPATVKMLLDAGADAKVKNGLDATALHWAACNFDKVRMLVDKGAEVNAVSKSGRSPLAIAAGCAGNVKSVAYLIDHGAEINPHGPPEAIPIVSAVGTLDTSIVDLLLSKGADVHADGDAALISAAGGGSLPIVKALLAKGADVNAVTPSGLFQNVKNGRIMLGEFRPLLLAATFGPYEMVKMLVDAGAKLDVQDVRGMTPLMYAVTRDLADPRVVKLLLDKGADQSLKMMTGETAVDWVKRYNDARILPLFGLQRQNPAALVPASTENQSTASEATRRSLALLQKTSLGFFKEGGCVSCHAQAVTAMAVKAAQANGLPIDRTYADAELKSARLQASSFEQRYLQGLGQPGDPDSSEYQMFLMESLGAPADRTTDAMIVNLLSLQTATGAWPFAGFSRSPMEHTPFSRTAMGIRAIRAYSIPGRKAELDAAVQKAAVWLGESQADTNEERVMQILGLLWAGKPTASVQKSAHALAGLQRADGGWGQTADLGSDAYATGQALYALVQSGIKPTDSVYRKGVAFLLKTQAQDGSWHVASRSPKFQPYFQSGFPYDHDQWISMAGTAWAAMALSYAAPADKPLRASR